MVKYNLMLLLLLSCFVIVLIGCTSNTNKNVCVKCGNTATTTLSGGADIMQKNGISIKDCKEITSNVYSAYVCDSCVGPVADVKPDLQ